MPLEWCNARGACFGNPKGIVSPECPKRITREGEAIDRIADHEQGQMLDYLRITKQRVGVILNFKNAKLEWERIVLYDRPNHE